MLHKLKLLGRRMGISQTEPHCRDPYVGQVCPWIPRALETQAGDPSVRETVFYDSCSLFHGTTWSSPALTRGPKSSKLRKGNKMNIKT